MPPPATTLARSAPAGDSITYKSRQQRLSTSMLNPNEKVCEDPSEIYPQFVSISPMHRFLILAAIVIVAIYFPAVHSASAAPIAIAEVKHEGDVDFEKEILPIFRRNCLACHSATEAQS